MALETSGVSSSLTATGHVVGCRLLSGSHLRSKYGVAWPLSLGLSVILAPEDVLVLSSDRLEIAGESGRYAWLAGAAAGSEGYRSGPSSRWFGIAWVVC